MRHKLLFTIACFFITCVSVFAATDYRNQTYFVDSKSDLPRDIPKTLAERSIEMKIYTLDMLNQAKLIREDFSGFTLDKILRNDSKSMNKDRKKKLKLMIKGYEQKIPDLKDLFIAIIDISFGVDLSLIDDPDQIILSDHFRSLFLDKLDESASRRYFANLKRISIFNYLKQLDSSNDKSLPVFINESAIYYHNPEFYSAYADFLLGKPKKNVDQIINYLLLGAEYKSAERLLGASKRFSNVQKIKIFELAQKPQEAYNLCLRTDATNHKRLYELALASGLAEEAYQNYSKLDPGDTQTLTRLSYQTGNYTRALEHARIKPLDDEYMLDLFAKTGSNYDALLTAIKLNDPSASQFADNLSEADKNRAFDHFVEHNEFVRASIVRDMAKLPESRLNEIRTGLDAEYDRMLTDPNINHQIVMDMEFGKDVKVWTLQNALQAKELRPAVKLDLGGYYELGGNYEAAYMYYVASHQYLKSINLHQRHLSNSAVTIDNEIYKRAGAEAEANEEVNLAISFYLKAGAGNDKNLSDLYRKIKDYDQAMSYQLKADPNDNQSLAELYELMTDYENAAQYYLKANLGDEALANARKIRPANYSLLIEASQISGKEDEVQKLLNEYYNLDYLNAGSEYIKHNKSDQYINKVVDDNKLDAVEQYNLYSEIGVSKLDELIYTFPDSGLNSVQKKIIAERLKHYERIIDSLGLTDLDSAIILAKKINDNKKNSAFVTQQQKVRAQIAEEEKKRKAAEAKLAKEREERIKKAKTVYDKVGGRYTSSRHPSDYVRIFSDGTFEAVVFQFALNTEIRGTYKLDLTTSLGMVLKIQSNFGPGEIGVTYSGIMSLKIQGFVYNFAK